MTDVARRATRRVEPVLRPARGQDVLRAVRDRLPRPVRDRITPAAIVSLLLHLLLFAAILIEWPRRETLPEQAGPRGVEMVFEPGTPQAPPAPTKQQTPASEQAAGAPIPPPPAPPPPAPPPPAPPPPAPPPAPPPPAPVPAPLPQPPPPPEVPPEAKPPEPAPAPVPAPTPPAEAPAPEPPPAPAPEEAAPLPLPPAPAPPPPVRPPVRPEVRPEARPPQPRPAPPAPAFPAPSFPAPSFPAPTQFGFNAPRTAPAAPREPRSGGAGTMDLSLGPGLRNYRGQVPQSAGVDSSVRVEGAQVGPDWIRQLHEWWQQHAYYPPQAAMRGEDGTVRLHLKVERDGTVTEVQLQGRSGSQWLDMGAVSIFRGAHLPPFPPGTPENQGDVYLTINFVLVRQ